MTTSQEKRQEAMEARIERSEELAEELIQKSEQTRGKGRPTKYKKQYCKEIIKLGELGYLSAMIASHFNVAKSTIHQWRTDYPEFEEAFAIAKTHAEAFYEKRAINAYDAASVNKAKWIASAYFRVSETTKQEVKQEVTSKITATVDFGDRE